MKQPKQFKSQNKTTERRRKAAGLIAIILILALLLGLASPFFIKINAQSQVEYSIE